VCDALDRRHIVDFGSLNFLGWRELSGSIPDEAHQASTALGQEHALILERINYQRGTSVQRSEIISFFLDDISALVREEYKDLKRDEW